MNETIAITNDLLKLANKATDRALARQTRLDGFAAVMVTRACQALQSTGMLAAAGFVGDAMSVARTIFELSIDLLYICKTDTEHRISLFEKYESVGDFKLARAISKLHDGDVDQAALSALEAKADAAKDVNPDDRARWWAGISTAQRAREVEREQLYELAYVEACGASHSGLATLRYVMDCLPTETKLRPGPGAPDPRPIALAATCVIDMVKVMLDDAETQLISEADALFARLLKHRGGTPAT